MWHDIRAAFAFLTILPMGVLDSSRLPGKALAWAPLVGLVIGGAIAAVAWAAPTWLVPYAAIFVWVTLTGALHLDGFADACDALFATTSPERRLEIMKDPHIGSWALIGVLLLLLGKFMAVSQVTPWALVVIPVAGRWAMTLAAWHFPYARTQGTGGYFRQGLGVREVVIASTMAVGAIGFVAVVEWRVLILFVIAPLVLLCVARFSQQRLGGGITGDIYGTVCEVCEWAGLLAVALLP